jgi:hypothetical protein
MPRPFLTTAWRDLLLFNWRVDPRLLQPHLPAGTELDSYQGSHYVSLVGFRFLDLAVRGVPALGYRDFPEVNLRFYVRREVAGQVHRGVVFFREMTPHRMVEWVARCFYNEPYQTLPMRYEVNDRHTGYEWQQGSHWSGMAVEASGEWHDPDPESIDVFFIEHYWGYNRQRDGTTMEYEVTHPKWLVRLAKLTRFDPGLAKLYGPEWGELLATEPESVVLAEGSQVAVFSGHQI